MRNKILLGIVALLLLSVGFASAEYVGYNTHGEDYYYKEKISKSHYDSRGGRVLTRSVEVYYDNKNRYSTRDYRHGYSYRTSTPYWEKHHDYRDVRDVRVIKVRDADRKYDKDRYYYERDYYDKDYYQGGSGYYGYKYDRYDYPYSRYSTKGGDYRYGTYRHNYRNDYSWDYKYDYDYDKHHKRYGVGSGVRYIPYQKSYNDKECYDYPPKGKLFYVKCSRY